LRCSAPRTIGRPVGLKCQLDVVCVAWFSSDRLNVLFVLDRIFLPSRSVVGPLLAARVVRPID
jgi:hypothetical protein